ncbi:MAG: tetratricopeptide repeat protein [Proteobacteria bacterium]|nr:tetratricopeptide repeat protein [Pseudomonadota bacterium]
MANNFFSCLIILFFSSFILISCVTPGSVNQGQPASDTVNNMELTVANSAQAAEELKAGQEQIKGRLEKLEHDLNTRMDELNKRLDQIVGVQTKTEQSIAGTQATSISTEIQPEITGQNQIEQNKETAVQTEDKGITTMPVTTDLSSISLDQRYKTAKKLEQEKNFNEAEKYYLSIINIPSKWYDERARFFLGSMYYDMNKNQEAIVTLQDFIDKYPKSKNIPRAILLQADSFVALNQKDNAEVFYKDLITRFPKTKEAGKARSNLKKL